MNCLYTNPGSPLLKQEPNGTIQNLMASTTASCQFVKFADELHYPIS